MQIREEMDSAIDELRELLSHPQEKNQQIERVGNRAMSETRPQIDELQAELLREVHTEIGTAFENAQDDSHMQQATLTKATDEKLRSHNQSLKSNVDNLQDLRKEPELLDLDLASYMKRRGTKNLPIRNHRHNRAHQNRKPHERSRTSTLKTRTIDQRKSVHTTRCMHPPTTHGTCL
jgi:hypothetical protein